MVSNAFYEEKLNKALTEIKKEIERLTTENDPEKYDQLIKEYQGRVSQIEEKIQQLEESKKDEDSSIWQKFMIEIDDIFSKMGAGFENVSAKDETDAVFRSIKDKDE